MPGLSSTSPKTKCFASPHWRFKCRGVQKPQTPYRRRLTCNNSIKTAIAAGGKTYVDSTTWEMDTSRQRIVILRALQRIVPSSLMMSLDFIR